MMMMMTLANSCFFNVAVCPHLSKESHSEESSQQPLARVHHLHHLGVGAVEGVVQVCEFLPRTNTISIYKGNVSHFFTNEQ